MPTRVTSPRVTRHATHSHPAVRCLRGNTRSPRIRDDRALCQLSSALTWWGRRDSNPRFFAVRLRRAGLVGSLEGRDYRFPGNVLPCRHPLGPEPAPKRGRAFAEQSERCAGVTGICCGIVLECCAGCVRAGRRRVRRSASVGIFSTCGSSAWASVGAASQSAPFPACTVNDAET